MRCDTLVNNGTTELPGDSLCPACLTLVVKEETTHYKLVKVGEQSLIYHDVCNTPSQKPIKMNPYPTVDGPYWAVVADLNQLIGYGREVDPTFCDNLGLVPPGTPVGEISVKVNRANLHQTTNYVWDNMPPEAKFRFLREQVEEGMRFVMHATHQFKTHVPRPYRIDPIAVRELRQYLAAMSEDDKAAKSMGVFLPCDVLEKVVALTTIPGDTEIGVEFSPPVVAKAKIGPLVKSRMDDVADEKAAKKKPTKVRS